MYRDSLDYAQDRFTNVLESCAVLTPAEVMEVLGIGGNSVYTLLNSGKLRGFSAYNQSRFNHLYQKNAAAFSSGSAGAFFLI